jgi:hypothetical protein
VSAHDDKGRSWLETGEIILSNETLIGLLKEVMEKKSSFQLSVKGMSMSPFIKEGDMVTISPLFQRLVGIGTPVACILPGTGTLVIHRVVGRDKDGYFIKGDNTSAVDGRMTREDVLGYVSGIERDGKRSALGLGRGRVLIAFLSRTKILPFIFISWRWIPLAARRKILSACAPKVSPWETL